MKEELILFDSNCMLGTGTENEGESFCDVEDLKKAMDYYKISKALVYGSLAKNYCPKEGNQVLSSLVGNNEDIYKSYVVLPSYTGEFSGGKSLLEELKENSVVSVRLAPKKFNFTLESWNVDALLRILEELKMPLFLDLDLNHWSDEVPWSAILRICKTFPSLTVILCRVGCGYNRILFPLMDNCPNLKFETGYFDTNNGIEAVVKRFGNERMLFGTDMPIHNPSCPIGMLYFSQISDADKQAIAHANLEKLIGGVSYGE